MQCNEAFKLAGFKNFLLPSSSTKIFNVYNIYIEYFSKKRMAVENFFTKSLVKMNKPFHGVE